MKRLHLALLLLPTPELLADTRDSALSLPDVVISANRQVQARNDSSAANTVFTRDDIDRLQPSSVTDLLSRVPGVQIAQTGGRGSLPGVFIRGTKSAQSLVLVDGQRIANATSGDSGLQFLSVDQIERVEVLRGSRSVVYGSDAIGGVIQIFTRRNAQAGVHPRLHVGYGSNQTWERSLGLSGGDERTRFNLGASLDETQGINWTHESFASDGDHDAYRNKSLSLNLSHSLSDDLEVGFNLLDGRGRSEYDNPFGRYVSPAETVGQKPYTDYTVSSASGYVDAKLNERWQTRLELGHNENRDKKRDHLSDEGSAFNTYRDSVNWQNDLTLDDRNSLILGGDWYEDRVRATTDFDEDSRWNRAVFIQHRFAADRFSTELGLRHDTNQQFGSQNTWSGTLTVPLNPDNDVLLSYSEGFRAPSFNDLYYPAPGMAWGGNPDLVPEQGKNNEMGLQWNHGPHSAKLLHFDNKISQLIQSGTTGMQNVPGTTRLKGWSAAYGLAMKGWTVAAAYDYLDAQQADGQTPLRRAKHQASLNVGKQWGAWTLGSSLLYVGSRKDADFATFPATSVSLPAYTTVDASVQYQLRPDLAVQLRVANLGDKRYETAYGFNQLGRAAYLTLKWAMR